MTHELEPDLTSPDQVSRANVIADAINRACVDKVRQAVKPKQVQDENGVFAITECVECGDEIPHARLVATGAVMRDVSFNIGAKGENVCQVNEP